MEDQKLKLKALIDASVKEVTNSFLEDVAEIRSMLQDVVGKMAPTAYQYRIGLRSSMEALSVKIPRFSGDDPAAWVFQVEQYFTRYNIVPEVENEDAAVQVTIDEGTKVLLTQAKEKKDNSDLDDNDEDSQPPVIAVGEANLQRDEAGQQCQPKFIKSTQNTVIASFSISKQLQLIDASANVLVNKVRKLFDICSKKEGQSLIDNEVVNEQRDTLILDGTRLMHKHIFIHCPFDPGGSVPLSIKFEYLNMHLDTLHWMPIALYSGVFGLDGTMEGGKLFNEMSRRKMKIQTIQPRPTCPLPKPPFLALQLEFLSHVAHYVEIAKKLNFDGLVVIGQVMTELSVIKLNFQLTFSTLPYDPAIHDIPLPYGADEIMFTDGSFPFTYILIVALWGEQVCGLGLKHVSIDAYEHFSSSLEVLLALKLVSLVRHMGIAQCSVLLEDMDPNCANIIELEKAGKCRGLELIPSKNFTSLLVMPVVRSTLTITYSKGHLNRKYYEGDKYIDMVERLNQACDSEALKVGLATWRVNVQLLTRTPTNFQVYAALLKPHANCTTNFLVARGSDCAHLYNYTCIRKLFNKQEVVLLRDMTHISGLIAGGVIYSPFKSATVFTCANDYTPFVLEKILFSCEAFDSEQNIFLVVSILLVVARSILDHMRFFGNFGHCGWVAIGGAMLLTLFLNRTLRTRFFLRRGVLL
ncbi:serine hydroxymethyltransferase 2, mitochondrial [Nicotiana attenuata]|uniref:Serine hydroxymethyltransferase 2, mitochondrial n=1 Tax=Nicotiana attenuata TaxID=49451 RepID=A0A1J6HXZ6_NICAT|nr:serine hydroxymethyltransferase 2, mitochondrial [Nicotiana attenuata]